MNKKLTVDEFFDKYVDEEWVGATEDSLDELFDLLEGIADDLIEGFEENSTIMGSSVIVSSHMGVRCKNLLYKIQNAIEERLCTAKVNLSDYKPQF